jgi:hypothetical protein
MWINTKSVFEWDKVLKKYVEIHNEGFEYEGEIALAGCFCGESPYTYWSPDCDCPEGEDWGVGACCVWAFGGNAYSCVGVMTDEACAQQGGNFLGHGTDCDQGCPGQPSDWVEEGGGGLGPPSGTPVYGCMDQNATNYDPDATSEPPGSCNYAGGEEDIYGCTDPNATNYNPNATIDNGFCTYDGGLEDEQGCTDPTASNYNPDATTDDGTCIYGGCTDPTAHNYNPDAIEDDGSCTYSYGCTDPDATNYDPNATTDDESCDYPYYEELNALNCNPGKHYIDSDSGILKYCPGGGGALGDPLSEYRGGGETWGTETGALGEAGGEMDLYDIFGGGRNIFDVLPENVLRHLPPQYWADVGGTYDVSQEIPSWETFGGNIRGLQSGTRTERRNIQDVLRGMNLGGGVSQTFAGGGGGVMPGREKTGAMSSFQDFLSGQAADLAGYELGFGEELTGMRQDWEDLVSGGYANVLSMGQTQSCNCDPNYVCLGVDASGEDICVSQGEMSSYGTNATNLWQTIETAYGSPDQGAWDAYYQALNEAGVPGNYSWE